jgi:carbon storage regulator
MLVLTRRPSESVVFPGLGITIRVAAVKGNAVRVGIEAPPNVVILRQELLADTGREESDEPTAVVGAG